MLNEYYKWIIPKSNDKKLEPDCLRYKAAEQQSQQPLVKPDKIIMYVNEFLSALGMECIKDPKIEFHGDFSEKVSEIHKKIKEETGDRRNLIWMKFTTAGYLGVVANGPINFDTNNKSYDIINHLGQNWDKTFVETVSSFV